MVKRATTLFPVVSLTNREEKGESPLLPERPKGGHRREALVVAQMGTVPFFRPGNFT
jgi:hypothetical protein